MALALCITFLGYVMAILLPFLRHQKTAAGDPQSFEWHVLIPCLDEERVVHRTVTRMREMHPSAHVWAIDDDSSDGTLTILEDLARTDLRVHVVRRTPPQARQGKGAALNAGWRAIRRHLEMVHGEDYEKAAERVVVGVIDADGVLDPDALATLSGPTIFGDTQVGAAQLQVRMVNRGESGRIDAGDPEPVTRFGRLLVTLQDLEFRSVIAAMQHLRRSLGSVGMGGNGQFSRLSVLDLIAEQHGTPWHGSLLEDFELGLHVLLVGRRNEYCNDVWVAQEGLPSARALVRQRTRWAQGGMECLRYLGAVLRSRNLSTPAALEICYFLLIPWTQLVGSVVYVAAWGFVIRYAVMTPAGVTGWFAGGAWGLIPLIIVFGIGPLAVWGLVYRIKAEPGTGRGRALLLGLAYWIYSYLMIVSVWRAAFRIARSKSDWVKTDRVYQGLAKGSAPRAAGRAHPPSTSGSLATSAAEPATFTR
ncbi:glycosyltransferase family 2 protein [Ornithinimicrobium cryptoxanthini]|uniref:Glycosyltransferase n=2 Tax=Ornithinimicrobium cryptoxanthini TaxID=2934161 RepID=A0ABY4YII2_9MICO|nr:glycosyltransferase family 2 protein [Ornithinimicrobium cryptoxanthini]USQ76070.1 glycosyltransferase [Ornithinimicrobium cryptoxanthini]